MARILGSRALGAAYLGLAVYCLLSLLAGPAGLLPHSRLRGEVEAMAANLESLKAANVGLRAELEALGSDPDRIAREARSLGYLGPNEYEIVLVGRRGGEAARLEAGRARAFRRPESLPEAGLKRIALAAAALAFLAGLLLRPPSIRRPRQGGEPGAGRLP